jgi:hypothetical protein
LSLSTFASILEKGTIMMTRLSLVSFTMALSTGLLAGCGGGGSGINSEVDGTKRGDELDAQELDQVCEATLNYLEDQVDVRTTLCKMAGVARGVQAYIAGDGTEEIQEQCNFGYDECWADDDVEEATDNLTCTNTPASAPDCEVTVDVYEQCQTDRVNAQVERAAEIAECDDLTEENIDQALADLEDVVEAPVEPASCDEVAEVCPNALDGLFDPAQ